jgi:hypothetical protein
LVGHWKQSSSSSYVSLKGICSSKVLAVCFRKLAAATTLDEVIGLVTSRHLLSPATLLRRLLTAALTVQQVINAGTRMLSLL